jgi:hypothetical protein
MMFVLLKIKGDNVGIDLVKQTREIKGYYHVSSHEGALIGGTQTNVWSRSPAPSANYK